jgi:hypothetical protein
MNTLRATINRLKAMTSNPTSPASEPSEERVLEHEIDALVDEIERMAGDPLFRGRPLRDTSAWIDKATGVPPLSPIDLQPSDLAGVEILEGRFESTNERLVGMFEESRRGAHRGVDWNPQVIYGLRAELGVAPISSPVLPMMLNRMRHNLNDLRAQIRDAGLAGKTADETREQILATVNVSVGAQANTSDRVVQTLLG